MIDYMQWKRTTARVSNLLLDPQNPRIPPTDSGLSQDELLAELIEHDKVYELAKKIVMNGYYVDESLIIAPANGKFIVVEGNRRLAALKVLLTPAAAPTQHQGKFRSLSAMISREMIKSVPVTVAPSREAALPRISERHTRPSVEQWETAQKARFYISLIETGKSLEDIRREHTLTQSELEDFLRLGTLYQMACSLDLPEDVQRRVENPRSFPLTNLERLLESQPGRSFLGVEPDSEHGFRGYVTPAEFRKGFSKVVTDVVVGEINSRILNDTSRIKKYLDGIAPHKPDASQKASFTAKDIIKKPPKAATGMPARQKPPRSHLSRKLIPLGLKCGVDSPRINNVFGELRRLNVNDFPNAVGIMLRVLLELSVSSFIHKAGKTQDLLAQHPAKKQNRPDWHPTLNQQLQFLLQHMNLPLAPLERKGLNQFVSSKDTAFSLDSLDLFVHNMNVLPTESDLRAIWARIEPLMRIILTAQQ